MQPTQSVHDNDVYAYSVDCEAQRLVLHTAFRNHEPHEFTDIVFDGVVAHHFEHVLPGNILFDVREVEVGALVRDYSSLFEQSWRCGWPPVEYRGDLNLLISSLEAASVRAYSIDSSYGMTGWVLAVNCKRVPRAEPATVE